jgi:hypothetical protein
MFPHWLSSGQVVAGNDLFIAALLLGVEEIAVDREGRPARPDRPTPQLDWRRRRPIRLNPYAANDPIPIRSAKAGPIGRRSGRGRGRCKVAGGFAVEIFR